MIPLAFSAVFRGYRINRTSNFPTREAILDRYRKFPAGSEIPVFYDPANAAEAILETGTGFYPFLYLLIAALVLLIFGVPLYRMCSRKTGK